MTTARFRPAADPDTHATDSLPGYRDITEHLPIARVMIIDPDRRGYRPYSRQLPVNRPIIAGRDPSCDIVLEHPGVSARHCALTRTEDGHLYVADLGSRNGTYICLVRIIERTRVLPCNWIVVGGAALLPADEDGRVSVSAQTHTEFHFKAAAIYSIPDAVRLLHRSARTFYKMCEKWRKRGTRQ